jgi:hypothetical protein
MGTQIWQESGGSECKRRWDNQVWKKFWKLEIPMKIKIFGWRVLHGVILCWAILANRHITNVGGCLACSSGCEDIKHIMFLCERSKEA